MHIPTSILSEKRGSEIYLFDPIRQKWILETPEERVRQRFIIFMVHKRGCPPSLISVEKDLKSLPHLIGLETSNMPSRRIDIILYHNHENSLKPLLMVECKAIKLNSQAEKQIIGYNHYVQAKYLSLVNDNELLTSKWNSSIKDMKFTSEFPHFQELIS